MSMHDVFSKEQMTLVVYYMWASQTELAIAADIMGIAIDVCVQP